MVPYGKSPSLPLPLGKSSSLSLSRPELSYERAELLTMASSPLAASPPVGLLPVLEDIGHIVRRSKAPHLQGPDHLARGLAVFTAEHYIRPYSTEAED